MDSHMRLTDPLDVIIVGAGIGGLSAGIAIRRAGHNVKIYERSDLNNEVGAAIHMCPNAARCLLAWGLDVERSKFVTAKSTYFADAETLHRKYEKKYGDLVAAYGAPWFFAHRVDLHTELKRLATSEVGLGTPVRLFPKSKVIAYDAEMGSITLADSTVHKADLIVAADGVHSLATEAVLGYQNAAHGTGQSMFRFLIPSSEIVADPETAHFLDAGDGCFKIFLGNAGNRIVWYSCRNEEVQNFGCFARDGAADIKEDWNAPIGLENLLNQYKEAHPSLLAVFRKAESIKKWPLLYRAPIPTWHKSKLVLVGDAAHPMLPHQGQAGAQAIEDSTALGTVLSGLNKNDLIRDSNLLSRRLKLFEKVRMNRASAIQMFSNAGQDEAQSIAESARPYVKGKIPSNPAEYMDYNFSYDVIKDSLEILRESEQTVA